MEAILILALFIGNVFQFGTTYHKCQDDLQMKGEFCAPSRFMEKNGGPKPSVTPTPTPTPTPSLTVKAGVA